MKLRFLLFAFVAGLCAPATVPAFEGELIQNHDGSFENGLTWGWQLEAPDYGSFAEGFVGSGQVTGMAVHLTTVNGLSIAIPDVYVWRGIEDQPGPVLSVVVEAFRSAIAFWPSVRYTDDAARRRWLPGG